MKDALIIVVGLLVLSVVWGGWVAYEATHSRSENIACTLDAKLCSDGSAVGRVGPHCEFAECPK